MKHNHFHEFLFKCGIPQFANFVLDGFIPKYIYMCVNIDIMYIYIYLFIYIHHMRCI